MKTMFRIFMCWDVWMSSRVAVLTAMVGASAVHAQAPSAIAGISTDTGDLAPRTGTAIHYNTTQLCLAATENVAASARRDVAGQLLTFHLRLSPLQDTLPARAIEVARGCLAQLQSSVPPNGEWINVITLALMAGQDTTAHRVADRWIASATSPAARDSVLVALMDSYLTAEPARPLDAEALVGRVAQGGAAGTRTRLTLYTRLIRFWSDVFDTGKMRTWADRTVALLDTVSPAQARGARVAGAQAYMTLTELAYILYPDSVPAIVQRAQRDWRRVPIDTSEHFPIDPASASLEQVTQLLSPSFLNGAKPGQNYPPLNADFWFPTRLTSSHEGFTLVVSTVAMWGGMPPMYAGRGCLEGFLALPDNAAQLCLPLYEKIRHLADVYGRHGLRIVLLAPTQGYAVRSLPLPPEKEAERLRWYFLDYLKLPVTVAVARSTMDHLPDGRIQRKQLCLNFPDIPNNDTSTIACKYLSIPMVLLDRDDKLLYAGDADPAFDAILDRAVNNTAVSTRATQ